LDVPHLLQTVPDLGQIAPLTLHVSIAYPSVLTLAIRP
jgi:hypothetical protein